MHNRNIKTITLGIIAKTLELNSSAKNCFTQSFLISMSKKIDAIEKSVQQFFTEHLNLLIEENVNSSSIVQHKYDEVITNIKDIANELLINQPNCLDAQEVISAAANDLVKIANNFPFFKYETYQSFFYTLCHALGGIAVKLGQNQLPIGLKESVQDDHIITEVSDGICAGLSLEWAYQSVTQGTPYYPITPNRKILNQQLNYPAKFTNHFVIQTTSAWQDRDLLQDMADLEQNVPYSFRLFNVKLGHRTGLRKNDFYIEIFEPNLGYLFFPTVKTAAIWFGFLLQFYFNNNLPAEKISINKYAAKDAAAIPKNTFLTKGQVGSVGIHLQDKTHYENKLVPAFRKHLKTLILTSLPANMAFLLLQSTYLISQVFNQNDINLLIKFLTACRDNDCLNNDNKQALKRFVDKKIYTKLLTDLHGENGCLQESTKVSFDRLINQLNTKENQPLQTFISAETRKFIEDMDALERFCRMTIHYLASPDQVNLPSATYQALSSGLDKLYFSLAKAKISEKLKFSIINNQSVDLVQATQDYANLCHLHVNTFLIWNNYITNLSMPLNAALKVHIFSQGLEIINQFIPIKAVSSNTCSLTTSKSMVADHLISAEISAAIISEIKAFVEFNSRLPQTKLSSARLLEAKQLLRKFQNDVHDMIKAKQQIAYSRERDDTQKLLASNNYETIKEKLGFFSYKLTTKPLTFNDLLNKLDDMLSNATRYCFVTP